MAPGRDCATASGSTGWTTNSAANHGTVSRLSRAYPVATAALSPVTRAAYRVPDQSAVPSRFTDQAAYPSRTTSSRPTAANVSAVPRRPRHFATSGTARASAVNPARISARPATPTAAQATAVKTTAAVPSSRPPRTNSSHWIVRVEVSGRPGVPTGGGPNPAGGTDPPDPTTPPGRTGTTGRAAGTTGWPAGRTAGGTGRPAGAGTRTAAPTGTGAGISRRIRAASSARWRCAASRRAPSPWYASRARSTSRPSETISRSSRTTSAAGGYGPNPQPTHPRVSSAGAPQRGQG
ncbi:hypothetical protein ACQP2H_25505 [Micromonospora sp. CA-248260]|uniref:hypothetical protein n=1 Tax=Micromonospora sp. CA-248260 TaxID=3239962 RepID=UPI003D9021F7